MSTERISNRRRFEKVISPATYGPQRRNEQSPPWNRRPAGGIRRYHRFRTPSDTESPNYEADFDSPEEEFAAERTIKSFPHSASENIFRGGFKHEVLKVSAEEAQTEMGETQVYFKAVAIVGDYNGNVGLGVDVALKPTRAARGAINLANDNVVSIRRGYWGVHKHGLPHTIFCKVNSTIEDLQVRVNPAPRGTGITGPPLARKLLEYAGVQDAYVIIRGEEPELATLCEAILSAVKDTFTIFQDKILQAYNVRRKEDLVTYNKTKVTELLPFNQPKGSCGNLGLFIPDVIDDTQSTHSNEAISDSSGGAINIPQTFSDFVPGAKAHLTATGTDDDDKENIPRATASMTLEDAAADAQDADKYIEEINQISIQFEDCDVKESSLAGVERYDENNNATINAFQDSENPGDYDGFVSGTGAAPYNEYASFDGWNPMTDFMGGGDNNAMQSVFNPTLEAVGDANATKPFPFGAPAAPPPPLQPRKRNPIPIVDPNDNGGEKAVEA